MEFLMRISFDHAAVAIRITRDIGICALAGTPAALEIRNAIRSSNNALKSMLFQGPALRLISQHAGWHGN
jgi:hypothetical protein